MANFKIVVSGVKKRAMADALHKHLTSVLEQWATEKGEVTPTAVVQSDWLADRLEVRSDEHLSRLPRAANTECTLGPEVW